MCENGTRTPECRTPRVRASLHPGRSASADPSAQAGQRPGIAASPHTRGPGFALAGLPAHPRGRMHAGPLARGPAAPRSRTSEQPHAGVRGCEPARAREGAVHPDNFALARTPASVRSLSSTGLWSRRRGAATHDRTHRATKEARAGVGEWRGSSAEDEQDRAEGIHKRRRGGNRQARTDTQDRRPATHARQGRGR